MATICRYEMSKACTIGRIVRPKRNDHESQRNNQYDAQRLCKGKPGCSKLCRQSQFKNTINREVYVKHENSRINHRQVVKGLLYLNLSLVLLGMWQKKFMYQSAQNLLRYGNKQLQSLSGCDNPRFISHLYQDCCKSGQICFTSSPLVNQAEEATYLEHSFFRVEGK